MQSNSLELLYFILAIAAVWIGVMLTWLLFELALMMRRANKVMKDALDKLGRFERAIMGIKEKMESSINYMGVAAEGGKALMRFLEKKKSRSRRRKGDDDEDDE